jgi:hypothetical protein
MAPSPGTGASTCFISLRLQAVTTSGGDWCTHSTARFLDRPRRVTTEKPNPAQHLAGGAGDLGRPRSARARSEATFPKQDTLGEPGSAWRPPPALAFPGNMMAGWWW